MYISDSYISLDLVFQGLLFLFYEPAIEDPLSAEIAVSSMKALQEAVDDTKYGGSRWSEIYKGPIPQRTAVSRLQLAWYNLKLTMLFMQEEPDHLVFPNVKF